MADLTYLVDTALAAVPVNALPLIDSTDFKTIEADVNFDAAGLVLIWHFVTVGGAYSQTAVTPTDTAGDYDWIEQGNGLFTIEIPASGGASINNDTEGFGWFTGVATGILPWKGPVCQFSPANVVNSLVVGSDVLDVSLIQILGAAITGTASQIVAAFTKWFNVTSPTGTVNSLPDAVPGAAGGAFIAGTNAATTVTTALTTTFTGNLTGSVASVTAGVTLAAAAVQAIWDALTSALTTAGSIGKLLVDNINATISSRSSQTSVDDLPTNAELASSQAAADDATLAAIAALNNLSAAQVNTEVDTALSDYDPPTRTEATADKNEVLAALVTIDDFLDTEIAAILEAVDTEVAAILADTNALQTDWADGGRLDLLIDAIKAVTDLLTAAQAEPSGVPAADETPLDKLGYVFMALRNRIDVSATKKSFYDDGGVVAWEKDLADDGTDYSESEGNAP